jgi:hypothetical protein
LQPCFATTFACGGSLSFAVRRSSTATPTNSHLSSATVGIDGHGSGWAYDFVFDSCANGQELKCLTVVDEFTHECLAIDVAGSIRSGRVIEVSMEWLRNRIDAKIVIGQFRCQYNEVRPQSSLGQQNRKGAAAVDSGDGIVARDPSARLRGWDHHLERLPGAPSDAGAGNDRSSPRSRPIRLGSPPRLASRLV